MSEINYSNLLREMVTDYFEHRVTRVEYLAQRRGLLNQIDREFNGDDFSSGWSESGAADLPASSGSSPDTSVQDITEPDITAVPKP